MKRCDVMVSFRVGLSEKEFEPLWTPQGSWEVTTVTLMNSISMNSFIPLISWSLCMIETATLAVKESHMKYSEYN